MIAWGFARTQTSFGASPSPNPKGIPFSDMQILVSDLFGFWR